MMIMMFWVRDTDIKPAVTDHLNAQKVAKSKNSWILNWFRLVSVPSRTEC